MSGKITVANAAIKYGVTHRTINRWIKKYEIAQFDDGTCDLYRLDALFDNYANPEYAEVDWSRSACRSLPTEFFYRIEDRGVAKIIDVDVFRSICTPCPIWRQCLNYAVRNENHGVWGGMTSDERVAIRSFHSSDLKDKVFKSFKKYGITKEMISQAIGRK